MTPESPEEPNINDRDLHDWLNIEAATGGEEYLRRQMALLSIDRLLVERIINRQAKLKELPGIIRDYLANFRTKQFIETDNEKKKIYDKTINELRLAELQFETLRNVGADPEATIDQIQAILKNNSLLQMIKCAWMKKTVGRKNNPINFVEALGLPVARQGKLPLSD